jgi:hypothetical protein
VRETLVRFSFIAALSLVPSAGHAEVPCTLVEFVVSGTCYSWWPEIPDEPLCSDYIAAWLKMAKAAEAKRCSPGGPMWATVYTSKNQGDFCLSAGTDGNNARTEEMKRVMSVCDACADTVDDVIRDIVDNTLYSCGFGKGFSNSDGRWTASRESQIARCVAAATLQSKAGLDKYLKINAQMAEDVRVCKLTHTNKNCISCHVSPAPSALRTIPEGGAGRDSIQRLKRPTKTSTKSGNDPIGSSDSINRAAPRKGSNTSGNDLANPFAGAERRAADPCNSPTAEKPCKPASSLFGPGILESDGGLARQSPARAGSAPGAGSSSRGATPTPPPSLR